MPVIETNVDVCINMDVCDFIDSCSQKECHEMFEYLKDFIEEDHNDRYSWTLEDMQWNEVIAKISGGQNRVRLTNEEQETIKNIANRL